MHKVGTLKTPPSTLNAFKQYSGVHFCLKTPHPPSLHSTLERVYFMDGP